jgi:Tol biopolymer transport system component
MWVVQSLDLSPLPLEKMRVKLMKRSILSLVIVSLFASSDALSKLTNAISHHGSTANIQVTVDGDTEGFTSQQAKDKPTLPRRDRDGGSPDGPPDLKQSGTIVFSSIQSGNQDIYSLDLATGRQTNLTNNHFDDGYPRMSPDGKKIAFATNRDGSWEIYIMNRDGSDQRNLTRSKEGNGYMDWSPDSQSLVFASTRYGSRNNDIYTIRADSSGLKRLTNHPAEDVHPVWSPDGKRIAFASERDGNREIYVMNSDGTNLIRLTSNRWYDDYSAWSPDGTRLAFASDRDSGRSDRLDIYIMNADGTNVRRIVNDPAGDDRHPTWSPDGKMIAFTSDREGDRDIFITRADGTSLIWLVSSRGNDEHPHWTSHSQTIPAPNPDTTPSTNFETFRGQNGTVEIKYPSDWKVSTGRDGSATFAPAAAIKRDSITHGARIGFVSSCGDGVMLMGCFEELLSKLWRANSYLRWNEQSTYSGRLAGKESFATYMSGQTPAGYKERVWVLASRFNGQLIYLFFVAPERDYQQYEPVFRKMQESLKLYNDPSSVGDPTSEAAFKSFRSLEKYFVIDYPKNWNANLQSDSSVQFEPNGANQSDLTLAIMLGYIDFGNKALPSFQTVLDWPIGIITRYRPYLSELRGARYQMRLDGKMAVATYLKGRNRVGRNVTYWIVAQPRGRGTVHMLFIAPDDQFDKLRATFETMRRSFKASFN